MTQLTYKIPGSLTIANGKGGVGKSEIALNLATIAAANIELGGDSRYSSVLVVDLDPQGNAALGFGIEETDEGKSLLAACMELVESPVVHETGRPNLRLIAGGQKLTDLANYALMKSQSTPGGLASMLSQALEKLATPDTLIIFDTPPATGSPLSDAALVMGEWLLVPTREDDASLDGVTRLVERILTTGSDISPIGVALFGIDLQASVVNAQVSQRLDEILDGAFITLDARIRNAKKAALEARHYGLTATEYADFVAENDVPWFQQLKLDKSERLSFAKNAPDLASDYRDLYAEVLRIIAGRGAPVS